MSKKVIEILSKTELFKNLNYEEVNSIFKCMSPKINTYLKNEIIVNDGEKLEGIGVLVIGSASVAKENANGDRVIMTIIKSGDLFGEIAAFSKKETWPATVCALDKCTIIFLSPQKLLGQCQNACFNHRAVIENMLKIVSDRAMILNRKVEYLTMKSIRGKISRFLLEQYKIKGSNIFLMPMNRDELADFLNITRPSLSRELCKMRDDMLIEFHRSSIKIINLKALNNIIE